MSDQELARLGQHVAGQEDARLEAAEADEGTRRFLAEYAAKRSPMSADPSGRTPAGRKESAPGSARTWLRLSLAALLLVALFALKEAVFYNPPLSFTVGGDTGVLRDWESAPDDARLPIRFSDGTLLDLEPGARARVVAVGRAGAEIVIESGRAHLDVVPARFRVPGQSPWRVSLGPFSVEVKGTRFDVEWRPHSDDFALDLFEGSVSVSGCEGGHSHTLVAGQGVRASCSKKQWSLISLADGERAERPAVVERPPQSPPIVAEGALPPALPDERDQTRAAPENGDEPRAAPPVAPRRGGVPRPDATATRSWRALALEGHYAAAYRTALELGFERECTRASEGDLALLGDTARLNGDIARAEVAYRATRQRFAESKEAARAAFALGRLAAKRDPKEAIRWFESYVREQPNGPLVSAADDWVFELAGRAVAPARQREIAKSYLERHPDGAYADDARRILQAGSGR